jgi:redox-sensitive bicupin YhaK (pirin superfamily)
MSNSVQARITPAVRDLGDGFSVRRAIPAVHCRNVGPFVFFDAFGPVELGPGKAFDVRPHPHIGLATVTYLFEGEILHRDSLGIVQPIRPGEVNWMTAGRGIAHSERTPPPLRASGSRLAGIQLWVALPLAEEEAAPSFAHYENLPLLQDDGLALRLILGRLGDAVSPVQTLSPMFYADAIVERSARLTLPTDYAERAIYVVDGFVDIGDETITAGEFALLQSGVEVDIDVRSPARLVVLGGPPLDAPRFVWWNFVSSRKERIRQAAADWKAGRFAAVPGETEFIPLPDRGPEGVVDYP